MPTQTYEIAAGYVTNAVVVHDADRHYWTPERITLSSRYQLAVYELARRIADERGARSIADIGCGTGTKLAKLFARLAVFGVDSEESVAIARSQVPRGTFAGADLDADLDLATLLPGCTRELVICADVIEHLARPDQLLASIRRFCTPDTRIVLSTPDRALLVGARARRPSVPDHVREWTADEFKRFVAGAGFAVLEQHHVMPFPFGVDRMTARYLATRVRYRLPLRSTQALVCRLT